MVSAPGHIGQRPLSRACCPLGPWVSPATREPAGGTWVDWPLPLPGPQVPCAQMSDVAFWNLLGPCGIFCGWCCWSPTCIWLYLWTGRPETPEPAVATCQLGCPWTELPAWPWVLAPCSRMPVPLGIPWHSPSDTQGAFSGQGFFFFFYCCCFHMSLLPK